MSGKHFASTSSMAMSGNTPEDVRASTTTTDDDSGRSTARTGNGTKDHGSHFNDVTSDSRKYKNRCVSRTIIYYIILCYIVEVLRSVRGSAQRRRFVM